MTKNKPSVKSYEDLMQEKIRLKNSISHSKQNIGANFSAIRNELNPFSNISSTAKNVLTGRAGSPLISYGVSTAANFLLRKFFFKKIGWLPRLILPLAVKKASQLISAPALNNKIVHTMQSAADKIRETDMEDVLPAPKDIIPVKAAKMVANTQGGIAHSLHALAAKIRR